ncbi:hypothetical protein HPP92_009809 [Vanilla planifolia]|uniref:Uncharacterized protein n=1 Tax=Vanilla planifolia TaxID=51239 RepID=A0A835RAZ1_VANPL|nr:hypothetical protein HPP92_010004 [Vanilla planifolia]KAG0487714.1 hypothetical protein HPP92_009809 [Vanilla planifolia]
MGSKSTKQVLTLVLASEDDQDALSTDPDELIESEDSEGISVDDEDVFRNFLFPRQVFISPMEITLHSLSLRLHLEDPAKIKRMLLPTKLSGSDGSKRMQQLPSEARNDYDSSEASPKPCPDSNGAATPPDLNRDSEVTDFANCHLYRRVESGPNEIADSHAVRSSDGDLGGASDKNNPEQIIFPPETSAGDHPSDDFFRAPKTNWPEQSEELLGLIVNSLRALDNAVPQGCPEPRRRPQSVQKIAIVLDKAPKHLQQDLITLVPKLVDYSEHSLAAYVLLDRLQKPDAEPSLRIPVFGALSQLEFGSEVWEHVLFQAFEILSDSHGEPLVAVISFIFKAAAQCQHFPQAVRAVRSRLKRLGVDVSSCVLDVLTKIVHTWTDIAAIFLKEINSDCELDGSCMAPTCEYFNLGVNGLPPGQTDGPDHVMHGCLHVCDVYILIEMLSIPGLFAEVSETFERAFA